MFFILYFSITVYYNCLRITTKLTEKYVVSQNSEYNFLHVKRQSLGTYTVRQCIYTGKFKISMHWMLTSLRRKNRSFDPYWEEQKQLDS